MVGSPASRGNRPHHRSGGPATRGRGASARVRRRRAAAVLATALTALGVTVILAGYVSHLSSGAASPAGQALSPGHAVAARRGLPAAEAGLMPWHLAAPVSRAVAVAGPPGRLIVLGGLTSGGGSASGVYTVGTATGAFRQVGALSAAMHDAAVAVIGGHAVVFGGGSPATVATVQS